MEPDKPLEFRPPIQQHFRQSSFFLRSFQLSGVESALTRQTRTHFLPLFCPSLTRLICLRPTLGRFYYENEMDKVGRKRNAAVNHSLRGRFVNFGITDYTFLLFLFFGVNLLLVLVLDLHPEPLAKAHLLAVSTQL